MMRWKCIKASDWNAEESHPVHPPSLKLAVYDLTDQWWYHPCSYWETMKIKGISEIFFKDVF